MTSSSLRILIFVVLMVALGQLSNTIFLASLPYMKSYFNVQKEIIMLSLILSLMPFGLSQLIYGPFSDFYGRKPVLLFGLSVFAFGSVVCLSSQAIFIFLSGRVIQGLGVGCVGPICRSIVRDTQSDDSGVLKYMSYVMMSLSIMPLLSPLLGSLIQSSFGWRYNFLFLLVYVVLFIFCIKFFMPETYVKNYNDSLGVKYFLKSFYSLFFNGIFMRFVILNMLAYSGDLIFVSDLSFFIQKKLKYTPVVFGLTGAILIMFLFLGNYLVAKFSRQFTSIQFSIFGAFLMLFGSSMLCIFSSYISIDYFSLVLPMVFFSVGEGLLVPSSNAGAMNAIVKKTGLASAFVGFVAMFGAGVMLVFFSFLNIKTAFGLALFLTFISIATFLLSVYSLKGVRNVFCKA